MKAVQTTLYVCGGLMAFAAVAGFVDYRKASKDGSLRDLYKEEKNAFTNNVKKEIEVEDYGRGAINYKEITEKDAALVLEKINKPVVKKRKNVQTITTEKAIPIVPILEEEKFVVSSKMFSRGPIRRVKKVDTVANAEQQILDSVWNY